MVEDRRAFRLHAHLRALFTEKNFSTYRFNSLVASIGSALVSVVFGAMADRKPGGMPGMRGIEHVGLRAPDIDAACASIEKAFYVDDMEAVLAPLRKHGVRKWASRPGPRRGPPTG